MSKYFHGNAGVSGTRVTTSDVGSGDAWTAVEDSATCRFEYTSDGRYGADGVATVGYRYGTDASGTTAARAYSDHTAMATAYGCVYLQITAAITNSTRLLQWRGATPGTEQCAWIFLTTSETIQLRRHDGSATGAFTGAEPLTLDTRYRLEFRCTTDGTANNSSRYWLFYPPDSTTAIEDSGNVTLANNTTISTIGRTYIGNPTGEGDRPSPGGYVYLDNIVLFNPGPTGPVILNQAQKHIASASNQRW